MEVFNILLLLVLLYFAVVAVRNLMHAVRQDMGPSRPVEQDRRRERFEQPMPPREASPARRALRDDPDIEDAKFRDLP